MFRNLVSLETARQSFSTSRLTVHNGPQVELPFLHQSLKSRSRIEPTLLLPNSHVLHVGTSRLNIFDIFQNIFVCPTSSTSNLPPASIFLLHLPPSTHNTSIKHTFTCTHMWTQINKTPKDQTQVSRTSARQKTDRQA